MLVITHHGEEDAKPLAIIESMDQVVDIIKEAVNDWCCPPIEEEMSIRIDEDYPIAEGTLYRVYEGEHIYDDWNCYIVTDVPYRHQGE
jgi:hypothetical protein